MKYENAMYYKRKIFFIQFSLILLLIFSISPLSALSSTEQKPLTVAEASNFTATSRYADVTNFIKELQRQSSLLRVETLCRSPEGREVPLLVIGEPVPSSPLALSRDGEQWFTSRPISILARSKEKKPPLWLPETLS